MPVISGTRRKAWILPGLLFALGALLATWPLILHFGSAIPMGSESTGTVPFFNLWALEWNFHSLVEAYRGYWNAPIFYPAEGAFAFSDPQPLTGLLALPFRWLGQAAAYNGVLLLFLWLNGLCAFALMRVIGASRPAALAAGLGMQLLPFLSHERGVLQLQPLFPMLLALLACVKMSEKPDGRWGAVLGLSLSAAFYTSQYYAMIAMAVLIPWFLSLMFSGRRASRGLVMAAAIAAVCVLPVATRQSRILSDYRFQRSLNSVTRSSAELADYLSPSQTIWLAGRFAQRPVRYGLYAGALLPGLALLGAALRRERMTVKLLLSAGMSFLLSLGTHFTLFGVRPYEWLWSTVPGFQHLRSPFRFGVWLQVCLVILAALALEAAWKRRQKWLFGLTAALLAVELFQSPTRLVTVPEPRVFRQVESPAVFFPYVDGSSAAAYTRTTQWMLDAEASGLVITNGYSGYFPTANVQLKDVLAEFPSDEGLRLLEDLEVRSVIVPAEWLLDEHGAELQAWVSEGRLQIVSEQQQAVIYQLP